MLHVSEGSLHHHGITSLDPSDASLQSSRNVGTVLEMLKRPLWTQVRFGK